jgi:ribosomal protein L32
MKCSTGKNSYYTESEVQEALIRSQISFRGSATNYYVCEECGEFHLTSRATKNPLLNDPDVIARIKKEQLEQDWQRRIK